MNNTITHLATSMNVNTPDLPVMSSSLENMRKNLVRADVLYAKTLYLPNLYTRVQRLTGAMFVEQQRLGESCMRLKIDIESRIKRLRNYDRELGSITDQDEIKDIQDERKSALSDAATTADNELTRQVHALIDLKESVNRQQTEEFQESLEQDVVKATARIEDSNARIAVIQEERRVLTEAIDAIESKGFANIAKDTLLTGEKILALGMQPPQIAVITLAIEQMKATLEYGGEGINFIALLKRRDALRERMDKLYEQLAQTEKGKLALTQRIELITCFHAMDDHRNLYVEQYQKVSQTIESFIALNQTVAPDDKERSARFISSGLQMISYLQPIR
ncbi:alpha-xenorhabdolysin family binary toxin subunit B [Pseudomonas capsici]|uniref:alpha-xenorhabdolysin family binary toxin subunit B n=1 Tax=Pseudomonas capsici TaxID=2810614 RepID=UPI0021F193B9|nr:alpha-xenorhabdolysin family binary toxin subunit B [Pseudomonas capsici]MCV4342687.1 alpha-xenorhabdolysin family binary toxin subunit B [Pseudomonas capsici]